MLNLLAQADGLLLGEDFLPWMVLAFGAALVVGNALALVRPPDSVNGAEGDQRPRPPLARALVLMAIGGVAAAWGAASLIA